MIFKMDYKYRYFSDFINPGLASNHLAVDVFHVTISVSANGHQLISIHDDSLDSGYGFSGLTAGNDYGETMWVNFDNFIETP